MVLKVGLVRPKLDTSNSSLKTLSDAQLFDLRANLIELSEAGYRVAGGLQAGINKAGNVQVYDMGDLLQCEDKESAYKANSKAWYLFLCSTEKVQYFLSDPSRINTFFEIYKLN